MDEQMTAEQALDDVRGFINGTYPEGRHWAYERLDFLRANMTAPRVPEGCPDDIRARGLTVAVHNDYRLNGQRHTFWLFVDESGMSYKGEGLTDADALNQVRALLAAAPAPAEPVDIDACCCGETDLSWTICPLHGESAPAPADNRPENCRNRLRDEGKPYPKSGCSSCGNGGLMGCPHERSTPAESMSEALKRYTRDEVRWPGDNTPTKSQAERTALLANLRDRMKVEADEIDEVAETIMAHYPGMAVRLGNVAARLREGGAK